MPEADGSLLGLGKGGDLWRLPALGADWTVLKTTSYPGLTKIEALADGTVLGIGTNGLPVTLDRLDAAWVPVPEGIPVLDVAALAGDTLLGIGADHKFMTTDGHPASWLPLGGPDARTVALAPLPNRSLVALTADGRLFTAPTADREVGGWQLVAGHAMPMISLAARPDGVLLGVGRDNKLYQRLPASGWAEVPAGGHLFSTVTVLPDGMMLGVDQAHPSLPYLKPG